MYVLCPFFRQKKIPAEFWFYWIHVTEYGIPDEFRINSVVCKYRILYRRNREFRKIYGIPELNSGGIPDKKLRKILVEFRNTKFRWTLYVSDV